MVGVANDGFQNANNLADLSQCSAIKEICEKYLEDIMPKG